MAIGTSRLGAVARGAVVAGVAAVLLAGGSAAASAQSLTKSALNALDSTIELGYSASGVGFAIMSASFQIKLNRSRYQAGSTIQTEGIAGLFMSSRIDTRSEGSVTRSGLRPRTFRTDLSTSRGRGAVSVTWEGNQFRITALPGNKPERMKAVQEKLRSDIPDPLSGLVSNALLQGKNPCTGTQRVFDGRRLHDLSFRFDRAVVLKGRGHYKGPAYRCRVKHTPIAGQSPEELSRERRSPSPHHMVWLAPVKLPNGAPTVLIPVKAELATDLGKTIVTLTRSTINGNPITTANISGG